MAFIYEDGTGIAGANSFASVEFADAYFADRGIVAWPVTGQQVPQKQAWLIQATDYIEGRFSTRFLGEKSFPTTQALSYPRIGYGMPINLLKATAEYALRAKTAPLAPDPKVDATGRAVAAETKKVGPISKYIGYVTEGAGSSRQNFRPYPAADMLLNSLMGVGNTVIRG